VVAVRKLPWKKGSSKASKLSGLSKTDRTDGKNSSQQYRILADSGEL
jgi:hypothetical protein